MIVGTLKDTTLLTSMAEAIIVVIPKPGKYPKLCTSYCPISLLTADAKILARRLNEVILTLIHEHQTGFTPGKGMDMSSQTLHGYGCQRLPYQA